jgi:hypothetical protein
LHTLHDLLCILRKILLVLSLSSYDQFSKQFLEEFLAPLGTVEISHEILGESQLVDVYFVPSPEPSIKPESLGLLGRIAQTPCLIEPFRNQPTTAEVRRCLLKLFQVYGNYQRQARRETESLREDDLPQLWILSSSASSNLLEGFRSIPAENWPKGVYHLPSSLKTGIVAINQLPDNDATLWLRLLGKGRTQQQAIAAVLALTPGDPRRSSILRILANWKISVEVTGQFEAEQELLMTLSKAYLEWEQTTEERGRQEGRQEGSVLTILRILQRRFGVLSPSLEVQIRRLGLEQLEVLSEAIFDFSNVSDVDTWLSQN